MKTAVLVGGGGSPVQWQPAGQSVIVLGAILFTSTLTMHIPYSKVCGMVAGYQKGTTDGYHTFKSVINGPYFNGVSITYGLPQKHIWSFITGSSDDGSEYMLKAIVLVQNILDRCLHHLFAIASIVNQVILAFIVSQLTVEAVQVRTAVVPSPTSRGSTDSYH